MRETSNCTSFFNRSQYSLKYWRYQDDFKEKNIRNKILHSIGTQKKVLLKICKKLVFPNISTTIGDIEDDLKEKGIRNKIVHLMVSTQKKVLLKICKKLSRLFDTRNINITSRNKMYRIFFGQYQIIFMQPYVA